MPPPTIVLAGLFLACRGSAGEAPGSVDRPPPDSSTFVWPDSDGDGVSDPYDCDDADPAIFPGAVDMPYDGVDENCDQADDYDADGDGFDAEQWGTDCDDANPARYAGAPRICGNGIDDDCDLAFDCDLRGEMLIEDIADGSYSGFEGVGAGTQLDLGDTDGDGARDLLMTAPVLGVTWVFRGPLLDVRTWTSADAEYPSGDWGGATFGDFDGDGRDDTASSSWPLGGLFHTPIWYAGTPAGAPPDADVFHGIYDSFFWVGAGDVDDDAIDDLLLGADYGCSVLDGRDAGKGCAEVFYGPLAGSLDDNSAGAVLVSANTTPLQSAPTLLSASSDLTGDGLPDLALAESPPDIGHFFVVEAPLEPVVYLSSVPIHYEVGQDQSLETPAVVNSGDLDGDGYADLLTGTRVLTPDLGAARVFRGPLAGALRSPDAWVTVPGVFCDTGDITSDVNGDGANELLLTTTTEFGAYSDPGQVRVYYSPEGTVTADAVIRSEQDATFDISLLAPAGDIDGDGLDDVVAGGVAAIDWAGGAWVFRGQPGGF